MILAIGVIRFRDYPIVDVLVEPAPWRPRRDANRRSRILDEHRRRKGDPATGGSTRRPIMTAYRQRALECAAALARAPARPRELRAGIPDAPKILLRNVYGWFVKVERGVYALSDTGEAALALWKSHLPEHAANTSEGTEKFCALDKAIIERAIKTRNQLRRLGVSPQ